MRPTLAHEAPWAQLQLLQGQFEDRGGFGQPPDTLRYRTNLKRQTSNIGACSTAKMPPN